MTNAGDQAARGQRAHGAALAIPSPPSYFSLLPSHTSLPVLVAIQLRSRDCQEELDRQKAGQAGHAPVPPAETQLRKC